MPDMMQNRVLRLQFSVRDSLTDCNPPLLLNKILSAFVGAGIPLAMGKEKHRKPIAHLAYPLPLGVEGLEEWADITIETGLTDSLDVIKERLRSCSPEGLDIIGVEQIPLHASSIAELCEEACWRWLCPYELFRDALNKIETFKNSDSFQITKTSKVEGKKSTKTIEVRHMVQWIDWDDRDLQFSTKIIQGQALNPQKIIAGIMDVGPEQLGKFQRERIVFKHDPKLNRHDKYAIKLRNLYEDAVLLESGPGLKVIEDDDDDWLSL